MYELLQPYIGDIAVSLVGLATVIILAILKELRKRVLSYIDSRNDLKQQELIKHLATQAFGYIEQSAKNKKSQEKLNEAIFYVSKQLEKRKVDIGTEEIKAAIETAVTEFNKDKK